MTDRAYNFSAGPAALPEAVIKQAQNDLWDLFGSGIGAMEHSHRGKVFDRVLEEAEADCRELGSIPDNYRVLFLWGGATLQNDMIPMNFLGEGQTADYFNVGYWAKKSIKQAEHFGNVNVACSCEDRTWSYLPAEADCSYTPDAAYCHYVSNNTIAGTQYRDIPNAPAGVPLICDASSDIYSKPIDVTKLSMLYAGAQKNLGPSGTVLAIMSDEMIEKGSTDPGVMLQYRTHAAKQSRYNTPNTFGIYLIGQVFKWIKAQGGLAGIEQHNEAKGKILYDFLDESSFYVAPVEKKDRSLMNVVFRCPEAALDAEFVSQAEANGLKTLKGHRSVGGMRASIYNAMPTAGVQALVDFMKRFELEHRA